MSTITTILGTDQPVNSRAVINTNFTNLNSTKKEDSMTTNKLLGRNTAGTGAIEEITLGTGLSYTGTTLNVTAGAGDMILATAQTNTALKTFLNGTFGLRNIANTITSFFSSAATVARTYTLQDRNGTLADDTDLATKAALAGSVSQAFSVSQLEVGNATDTTLSRVSAGIIAVEGITISSTLYPTVDTDGATVTFNLAANNKHQVTIAGNRTLALSNTTNVPVFSINIKQDATGSRTVTWFSGITWAGGTVPTLTTTANKTDSFGFQQISAGVYLGFIIGQNI